MEIRGEPGRYAFFPATPAEHAILSHAWRKARKHFSQFDEAAQRAIFYWGDAEGESGQDSPPSAREDPPDTSTFILATWDRRDYAEAPVP